MSLKALNSWKCFGGTVHKYVHASVSTSCDMKVSVFIPPQATSRKVPALYFLSGLTCNEDNFITKAGACRLAAREGLALICPDTSPRGVKIEGDSESWDFGVGAGFYVNATLPKWSKHYQMYNYVVNELPSLLKLHLPLNHKQAVSGHSMGGHGALISFLKNPGLYSSVSAFSPICNPTKAPWGIKAFSGYLGPDTTLWKDYDATELLRLYRGPKVPILIDQGSTDEFLSKKQLLPEHLQDAAKDVSYPVSVRMQLGYDHSYWFIQTFIDDHIEFHSQHLHT